MEQATSGNVRVNMTINQIQRRKFNRVPIKVYEELKTVEEALAVAPNSNTEWLQPDGIKVYKVTIC